MSSDGRVWNVYSYPGNEVLHTADTYEACESWRRDNNLLTYICPQWPEGDAKRFSLIMLNDSGASLGIPIRFRGTIHAYTRNPKRRFDVTFTDTRANVTEVYQ